MSLSAKQRRAARYLGIYMTQRDVGLRIVVNPRTIRRWLTDDPEFAAQVQVEKDAARELLPEDVLQDLLLDPDSRVRLAAAQSLIRLAPQTRADDDPLIEFV